jgi:very-short-patch-repair endonuclease
MSDAVGTLSRLGGVAHLSALRSAGVKPASLRELVKMGTLLRPRAGWYALPGAPAKAIRATSVGGRVTCISALAHWGVWCVDDLRLHLSVAGNASGQSSHRSLVVHYSRHRAVQHASAFDGIVHALAHTFGCQSRENVIVAISSALNQGLIGRDELDTIRMLVASKYWPYFDFVDGRCESGLETKCLLRLRALNIRCRTQVYIRGVGRVDVLVGDRLVVETDGIAFHSGEDVKRDRRRDLALHRLGYVVLRVDYGQVMNEWESVEEVIRAYVSRDEHHWSARHIRAGLA